MSSIRCKACDTEFHPRWRKDIGEFEDLCWKCLPISLRAARTDEDLYGTADYKWENEDKGFVQGFVEDKLDISDTGLEDDPYYQYGEDAFGELDLFDKY
jgi:hypothetical protein